MLMELPKTPIVDVHTTNNRGFTPEEVAKRCADKIVEVSDKATPEIREQARAFKEHLEKVIAFYMKEAIKSAEQQFTMLSKTQDMKNLQNT
tara:strand:+ start:29 stop:301 length:273 start_codon:yes stop_codon:yes gene_type:complete